MTVGGPPSSSTHLVPAVAGPRELLGAIVGHNRVGLGEPFRLPAEFEKVRQEHRLPPPPRIAPQPPEPQGC